VTSGCSTAFPGRVLFRTPVVISLSADPRGDGVNEEDEANAPRDDRQYAFNDPQAPLGSREYLKTARVPPGVLRRHALLLR